MTSFSEFPAEVIPDFSTMLVESAEIDDIISDVHGSVGAVDMRAYQESQLTSMHPLNKASRYIK